MAASVVTFKELPARVPKDVRIVSFDIFDTVLTRKWISPHDVFQEVEHLSGIQDFSAERKEAEFALRKKHGFTKEVYFKEIYAALSDRLALSHETAASLMDQELALEKEGLYAVPGAVEALHALRTQGKSVVFVSDIYLPYEFIAERLREFDLFHTGDRLYVSSDADNNRALKSAGTMFPLVLEKEGASPAFVIHVGDNEKYDVHMAQQAGMQAALAICCKPTRYETAMGEKGLIGSRVAGVSRRVRLMGDHTDTHKKTIWDTTANIAGPLIVSFVHWCMRTAMEQGKDRLYFFARDGQILWRVARILNEKLHLPLGLNYFYASRQALLPPAIGDDIKPEMQWILAPTSILTPRIALKRINMSPEDHADILEKHGVRHHEYDTHMGPDARLRAALLDAVMQERIKEMAAEHRKTALGYFSQEGIDKNDRFAVVDIGWSGTLQRSMSRLLQSAGVDFPVYGYYFGLKNRSKHKDVDRMFAFFSDYRNPHELESHIYIVPLLEMFFAADHGGTVRYEKSPEGYIPVLKEDKNTSGLGWGVDVQQEAVCTYARCLSEEPGLNDCLEGLKAAVEGNLKTFMLSPNRNEAKVYGAYQDAEDQNESYSMTLARPYNLRDLFRYRFFHRMHHHNEWFAASMTLTSAWQRKLFNL